ncbi:MAG: Verru_Chthon cassette protein A [Verrucomicrobiales bacterium]
MTVSNLERSEQRRGVALILVLVVLAMLTVLLVAFFSFAKVESQAAHRYADTVRAMADEEGVINLVIAQLREATGPEDEEVLWVSQPGAIRHFGPGRSLERVYKLYSATELVSGTWNGAADVPPATWADEDLMWTDLNEPRRFEEESGERVEYPILDPRAVAVGFARAREPGGGEGAMPVRWLYVLQDQTIVAPVAGPGGVSIPGASAENPVVKRLAFWTDDESCKININTASEPTPWDTPRCIGFEDMAHGTYQPVQREYQRYPGHPYTTALSPVLFPGGGDPSKAQKEAIYGLLPRVKEGGSEGGTVRFSSLSPLVADEERLFASVDELIFRPDRTEASSSLIDPEKLRRARFFLTAQSRAPELNAFGLPRISMWPVAEKASARSVFDRASLFCSTLNARSFAWQRSDNPYQSVAELGLADNQKLLNYLGGMTARDFPGYGSSLASVWGDDHWQVGTEVFDYIRSTNLRDASNLSNRYAGTNGQVNPLKFTAPDGTKTQGFGRAHTISEYGLHFNCMGDGNDADYNDGNPALDIPADYNGELATNERYVEAAFIMEPFSAMQGYTPLGKDNGAGEDEQISFVVKGLSSLQVDGIGLFTNDSASYDPPGSFGSAWHGRGWGGVQSIRTFIQGRGGNYPFLGKVKVKLTNKMDETATMDFSGGTLTVEIYLGNGSNKSLNQTVRVNFPSATIPVPHLVKTGTTRYDSGDDVAASGVTHWWRLATRYGYTTRVPHAPSLEYLDASRRWPSEQGSPGFKTGGVFRQEDVVRTVTTGHGDHRILAGQEEPPVDLLQPNYFYHSPTHHLDHTFSGPLGPQFVFGFGNEPGVRYYRKGESGPIFDFNAEVGIPADEVQLTPADYHYSRLPDVRVGSGAFNRWGDFDNGVSIAADGAYINKPDEGNINGKAGYSYYSTTFGEPQENLFSPNRMIPSPGMLGSLPTGVKRGQPWQTLLFRPQAGHPGERTGGNKTPDHLLLDFFWMPVIEPYPISEPFSTAGKINVNYQIVPFTWLKRATGMHAALKALEPSAIPNKYARAYKLWDHSTSPSNWMPDTQNNDTVSRDMWREMRDTPDLLRKRVDIEQTLTQFDERFDNGELFLTASEICEIHLPREGESLAAYENGSFWKDHAVTGDNTRERPYTNLYGRLTTRSNVYQVHYRVQLVKNSGSQPGTLTEENLEILSEKRGSVHVERYLDPNEIDEEAVGLMDPDHPSLEGQYRYRVTGRREF